jgi:hypothetical protein
VEAKFREVLLRNSKHRTMMTLIVHPEIRVLEMIWEDKDFKRKLSILQRGESRCSNNNNNKR